MYNVYTQIQQAFGTVESYTVAVRLLAPQSLTDTPSRREYSTDKNLRLDDISPYAIYSENSRFQHAPPTGIIHPSFLFLPTLFSSLSIFLTLSRSFIMHIRGFIEF